MAFAKNQADWNQTSNLMAVLININREKNRQPVKARDLNPYAAKQTENSKPDFYITPRQLAKKIVQDS